MKENNERLYMANIEATQLAEELDNEGMIGFVRNFVDDLAQGMAAVDEELQPWITDLAHMQWSGVLCVGMGGSAAGGDFLSALADDAGELPIVSIRDYSVPNWWGPDWLVVATSYSGNTEETITFTNEIVNSGGTIVAVASGGLLAGLAELHEDIHLISLPSGQPPRSAFGHIFSRQLALMNILGIIPTCEELDVMFDRLEGVLRTLDILDDEQGVIMKLAMELIDKQIAILTSSELHPAAIRMKNQLNENSARFARIGVIPEMNHNELVAWGGIGTDSDPSVANQAVLVLTHTALNDRVRQRLDWQIAHLLTDSAWRLDGEGSGLLESLLHHCIIMDWLSIALALLHGKDPATIGPISSLKSYLDQS